MLILITKITYIEKKNNFILSFYFLERFNTLRNSLSSYYSNFFFTNFIQRSIIQLSISNHINRFSEIDKAI